MHIPGEQGSRDLAGNSPIFQKHGNSPGIPLFRSPGTSSGNGILMGNSPNLERSPGIPLITFPRLPAFTSKSLKFNGLMPFSGPIQ